MKRSKKIVALCLIAVMALGMLSACSGRSYVKSDENFTGTPSAVQRLFQDVEETVNVGSIDREMETTVPDDNETDTPVEENQNGETETPGVETPGDEDQNGETGTPTVPNTPVDDEEEEGYTTSCMSFNVLQWDTHGTGYAAPEIRAPWILDTIKNYDPDLLGTQEVTKATSKTGGWDMYQFLVDSLSSEYDSRSIMEDDTGTNVAVSDLTIGSGLVIFWKKDRFELKDSGAKVYSIDAARHYQWVKLYDKQEQVTILMTNTHYSINGDDAAAGKAKRASEAAELYNFWDKNCEEGMPMYGTGDYNHTSSEGAFDTLNQGRFQSSRSLAATANASSNIDFVYINFDVQEVHKYTRCNETYEPAGVPKQDVDKRNPAYCPSDHYAIIAYCSNAYL